MYTHYCDIYCECVRGCDVSACTVSACAAGNKRISLESARCDVRLTGRSPIQAGHVRNRPIPITGWSIGASLVYSSLNFRSIYHCLLCITIIRCIIAFMIKLTAVSVPLFAHLLFEDVICAHTRVGPIFDAIVHCWWLTDITMLSRHCDHPPTHTHFLRSAHFVFFSYRFRRLYYSTVNALRSGHHITGYSTMIPVGSERICSIQRALKCARCEFKLYVFTEVYYVTLHASLVSFVCVCEDAAQCKSVNEWTPF